MAAAVTPATGRAVLLHLLIAWVGVLAAGLAWRGATRLGRRGRDGAARGVAEVAGGLTGLAWVGWLLW